MIYLLRTIRISLFFSVLFFCCIERDNWWDPYNGCHPLEELPGLRLLYENTIQQELRKCDEVHQMLAEFQASLLSVKNGNSLQVEQNKKIADSLIALLKWNDSIALQNSLLVNCSNAQLKALLPKSPLYKLTKKNTDIEHERLLFIGSQKLKIDSIIGVARNSCVTQTVLEQAFIDASHSKLTAYEKEWIDALKVINGYYDEIISANRAVDSLNRMFDTRLLLVETYNDSIAFCQLEKVRDTTLILEKLATIRPGEALVFAADTVKIGNFQLKNRGSMDSGRIVIRGKPAGTVMQIANGCEVSGSSRILFVNIIFSGTGNGVGIRVRQNCDSILFNNCQFVYNRGYGIEIDHSQNIVVENCRVLHNGENVENTVLSGRGGIRIAESGIVTLRNVLVAKNLPYGIDINKAYVELNRSTVSDNQLDGIRYTGETNNGGVTATSVIISYHSRAGIYRNDENDLQDIHVEAKLNNRFFSNRKDMDGDPENISANIPFLNADPQFADRQNDNYRIGEASELFGKNIGFHY